MCAPISQHYQTTHIVVVIVRAGRSLHEVILFLRPCHFPPTAQQGTQTPLRLTFFAPISKRLPDESNPIPSSGVILGVEFNLLAHRTVLKQVEDLSSRPVSKLCVHYTLLCLLVSGPYTAAGCMWRRIRLCLTPGHGSNSSSNSNTLLTVLTLIPSSRVWDTYTPPLPYVV